MYPISSLLNFIISKTLYEAIKLTLSDYYYYNKPTTKICTLNTFVILHVWL